MSRNRPFVLSIAGFDPSGGAGVLADIKTFEQHKVYGLAIITGNTIQTENGFMKIEWIGIDFVLHSIEVLFEKYDIKVVKIGIVPSLEYLEQIIFQIKNLSDKTKIIWDTVLKSSTKFDFLEIKNQNKLEVILKKLDLITPNYQEILHFFPEEINAEKTALHLSNYCAVLLKGGHNTKELGVDYLFFQKNFKKMSPNKILENEKHGTGCVLSAAISANLSLGFDTETSCLRAKLYIEKLLVSNTSLLGYHHD